jgi:hypothetical protein
MLMPPFTISRSRALRLVLATQQVAIALLLMEVAHALPDRTSLSAVSGSVVVVLGVTSVFAFLAAPVAAVPSRAAAVPWCALLGVGGGAMAGLASAVARGTSCGPHASHLDHMMMGAMGGLFAGLAGSVVVLYALAIPGLSLDGATRIYAAAGGSMLPPAVVLLILRACVRSAPWSGLGFAAGGLGLVCAALASSARGLAWLARVRAGREPGLRIERDGATGLLVHASSGLSRHPFRHARGTPLTRVPAEGSDLRNAMRALRDALVVGLAAGVVVLMVLGVGLSLMLSLAIA